MKAGFVRMIGLGFVALGAVVVGACNDDPLDFDVKDTTQLRSNPSFMLIPAGRTGELEVVALNDGAEPTFDDVTADVGNCGTGGAITVRDNPADEGVAGAAKPPGSFLVDAGSAMGTNCVISTAAGVTDTTEVVVVADAVDVVDAPASIKLPGTGTVQVRTIALDSTEATPSDVALGDYQFSVDTTTILTVDNQGNVATVTTSGTATVSAVWTGNVDNGTAFLDDFGRKKPYVTRETSVSITVLPGLPVSAGPAFLLQEEGESTLTPITLVAIPPGASEEVEIWVLDGFTADREDGLGNKNTLPEDILGVTAVSSDPSVATVSTEVRDIVVAGTTIRGLFVTINGLVAGSATVSGTAETSAGSLAWDNDIQVAVLAPAQPVITAVTPDNGDAAATAVITGSGFLNGGWTTTVLVNDGALNNISIDSDTQITAQMPTLAAGTYDVVVQLSSVLGDEPSNTASWTQNTTFDEAEPANDNFATAPDVSFPMSYTGVADAGEVVQAFGHYDLYRFTLSQAGTINITLTWDNVPADLDVYIWDQPGQPDGTFGTFPTGWACGAAGGSGGGGFQPETTGDCSLPAGDYLVWIYDFGAGTSNYTVEGTFTP